jgi:hypothetical protein
MASKGSLPASINTYMAAAGIFRLGFCLDCGAREMVIADMNSGVPGAAPRMGCSGTFEGADLDGAFPMENRIRTNS